MKQGTPDFIGSKLTEAREARGIVSKKALADMIERSPSAVSRWEDGAATPEPAALSDLSRVLRVREEFFTTPRTGVGNGAIFWRSLAATLKRDRATQTARLNWLRDIVEVVDHYVFLPEVDIPDALNGRSYKTLRNEDLEAIALDLRSHWNLGEGPVGDMVEHLQRVGFVVASEEMESTKLDGMCRWDEQLQRPLVLLALDKNSYSRRQFDAGHEMSHAILHRNIDKEELRSNHKLIESQANRLSSAFLLPSTQYPLEISSSSIAKLESLKLRWKVSIKAQIMRLKSLNIIDQDGATRLFRIYSAKGYSRREPFDDQWPIQEPRLLAESFRAIVTEGQRTKRDLIEYDLTIPAFDIARLSGLPDDWFDQPEPMVVRLKPRRQHGRGIEGRSADIISFKR